MKGLIFLGKDRVELREFPDPKPDFREVIVRMKASAICRSDLALYHGNSVLDRVITAEVIPGHEVCGIVEMIGKGVSSEEIRIGDRVAVYLAIGCGSCIYCRKGWNILCPTWKCLGFDIDGGHAELVKVPVSNCLKMPDNMTFIAGALSTDKFGGLYHSLKNLNASARDRIAIFGAGPMGQMGILCAKNLGAYVISVDVLDNRLEQAKKAGADMIINSNNCNLKDAINDLTDGMGVDIAIDCSGNPIAENNALDCVKREGKVAFIGESKKTLINPSDQFIRKMLTATGSWYFPIWEYDEITNFMARKNISLENFVTHIFKLEDAQDAYELFDKYETGIAVFQG